ncbi:MAG TPA: hypothetical protein VIR54_31225 [Vicinamibacterales bacterium]
MTELSAFQKEALRLALGRMFRPNGWFDICTVDNCLKLAGAIPSTADYNAMRVLHCVNFSDMTPEMRRAVADATLALFDAPGFDLPQLDRSFLPPSAVEETPKPPTLWQRAKGALTS